VLSPKSERDLGRWVLGAGRKGSSAVVAIYSPPSETRGGGLDPGRGETGGPWASPRPRGSGKRVRREIDCRPLLFGADPMLIAGGFVRSVAARRGGRGAGPEGAGQEFSLSTGTSERG
jgi:hypothetical protein